METPPPMQQSLRVTEAGTIELQTHVSHPRLERAFKTSVGAGLLDLIRHGLPDCPCPAMRALHERARYLLTRYLRRLRQGAAEDTALAELAPSASDCAQFLESLPPLSGAPLSVGMLQNWLSSLGSALQAQAEAKNLSPEAYLSSFSEAWQDLGTMCFLVAENGGHESAEKPFAFLATVVHGLGQDGKARHMPLGLHARSLEGDSAALLALMRPLQQAAREHAFVGKLLQNGSLYQPCAWSARECYEFLEAAPAIEAAGIELRMVNLWKTQPPKVELEVQFELAQGEQQSAHAVGGSSSINVHSLLHFSPQLALGGRNLSEQELAELMASEGGLVRFRGEWVRLERELLQNLLNSWRQAARMAAGGIPLLVGLRYLLGKRSDALPNLPPLEDEHLSISLGEQLTQSLQNIQWGKFEPYLSPQLEKTLRSYQKEGVRFLLNTTESGFGACLADDMGLGKTLQVISWLAHLQHMGQLENGGALIVAPASLLDNWVEEVSRFAPQLSTRILHPSRLNTADAHLLQHEPAWLLKKVHVGITSYGMVARCPLLARASLPALILDEAQAIKNADSQRTQSLLELSSPRRVALTGTPVENDLEELRSLFEFLNPGLLGTSKMFKTMLRDMGADYTPLRRLIRPFILRRLKSDPKLLPELPPKTEQAAYCSLTPEQARLYQGEVENLRAIMAEPDPQVRLTLMLPILARFKQICNHPAQYLGEPNFEPERSGKMMRLAELIAPMARAGECCLIFTQYRSMLDALQEQVSAIYGELGLCLHGGTPLGERQELVKRFQQAGGPPFMLLSLKAAGTGLTLTRARHVIHFDRWWNPAVENQASDRAYRIGQQNPVIIHPLITRGTMEQNIHRMLLSKQALADDLLSGGLEKMLLHLNPQELLELVGA